MTAVSAGRASSYVLLDAAYDRLGLAFEPALYCVTTVVSRAEPTRAVLDAGLKALVAGEGLPVPAAPGPRVVSLSDEHARLAAKPRPAPATGDKIFLIPSRIDPTVNLHDAPLVDDGQGLERWPIDGRRVTTPPDLQDLPR